MPACLCAAASSYESPGLGTLSGPSDLLQRVASIIHQLFEKVLHCNSKRFFAQLWQEPDEALISTTPDTAFNAWLLAHLLSNSGSKSSIQELLKWQNSLVLHWAAVQGAQRTAEQVPHHLASVCFYHLVADATPTCMFDYIHVCLIGV